MKRSLRILYAGDSAPDGPARYLYAILKNLPSQVTHIPPAQKMKPGLFKVLYDVIILSDYSRKQTPDACQKAIERQVAQGTGFLMVGGWGSFSGPFGGWRDSLIERLLPVQCRLSDDRQNFPGGAHIIQNRKHQALGRENFQNPPVIVGMNRIQAKKGSKVLLSLKPMTVNGNRRASALKEWPLLVIDSHRRIAAFSTDFAPHWCGGFVDWGDRTMRLSVTPEIRIEVGDRYVRFISTMVRWLAGAA